MREIIPFLFSLSCGFGSEMRNPLFHLATENQIVIKNEDGTYKLAYKHDDGFRAEVKSADGSVQGVYAGDGIDDVTAYISDKTGHNIVDLKALGVELPPLPYYLHPKAGQRKFPKEEDKSKEGVKAPAIQPKRRLQNLVLDPYGRVEDEISAIVVEPIRIPSPYIIGSQVELLNSDEIQYDEHLDSTDSLNYADEEVLTDQDLFPIVNNEGLSNISDESGQFDGQTSSQSSSQSTGQSSGQSSSQSTGQSSNQSTSQSTNQSNGQASSQSIGQLSGQSTGQSTSQSTGQSTGQSISQSTDPSSSNWESFQDTQQGINAIKNDPLNEQVNNDNTNEDMYPIHANTGGLANHQNQLLGDDLWPVKSGIPVAQTRPSAVAISGPNGTAQSAPIGTAIVGTNGLALSLPVSTSLAGQNGLAVSAPSASSQAGVGGIAIAGGQSIAVAGLVSPDQEISQISGAQKQGLLAHLGNLYPSFLQHLEQFYNQNNQQNQVEGSIAEPAAESVGIPKHPNKIVPAGAFDLYSNLNSNLNSDLYSNLHSEINSKLYSNINSNIYSNLHNKYKGQAVSIPIRRGSSGGSTYIYPRVTNYFVAVQPEQLYSMLNK